MAIPITGQADRARVEAMLIEAARRHAVDPKDMAADAKEDPQHQFGVEPLRRRSPTTSTQSSEAATVAATPVIMPPAP